jgi:predicted ester cyclase
MSKYRWSVLYGAVVVGVVATLFSPCVGQTTSENKDLVTAFVSAVNSRTYEVFDEIIRTDFQRHCQATPQVVVRSLEDFKSFILQDLETFPDGRVDLTQVIAEGDRVAYWGTYRGTQKGAMGPFAPTNNAVELDMAGVFRIQDGKIAELWITWDNLAVFSQLGINPMGTPDEDKTPVVKE